MGCCEDEAPAPQAGDRPLTLALAGNPNCGKSALFNALTGIRQKTGNWPGVTVERKEGRLELDGRAISVIDLSGIYSLDAGSAESQLQYALPEHAEPSPAVLKTANVTPRTRHVAAHQPPAVDPKPASDLKPAVDLTVRLRLVRSTQGWMSPTASR